jgi:hypothetical protein
MLKAYRFTFDDARMRHRRRDRAGGALGQRLKFTIRTRDEFFNDRGRQNPLALADPDHLVVISARLPPIAVTRKVKVSSSVMGRAPLRWHTPHEALRCVIDLAALGRCLSMQ